MITLLDGPMGARLQEAGYDVSPPAWSARILRTDRRAIEAIHREYAFCDVARANTFRTTRRACPDDWADLARLAVELARTTHQRVAGSIGPLEDCYRPDLAPKRSRAEHEELTRLLAPLVDLFICETFPNVVEAREAVEACAGKETWVSFTAGPDGTLLTPAQVGDGAKACVDAGAKAVLINCVAAELTLPYVEALASAGVPFGAYANTATWNGPPCTVERYAELAAQWRRAGATLIGGCCGTTARHLEAVAAVST